MITFFKNMLDFFAHLDKKQMQRLLMATIGGAVLLLALVFYLQFRQVNNFKREMTTVNNARMRIKEILERNELRKKQQKRGEEILSKDKNFKLKEYVNDTVEKLKLQGHAKIGQVTINDVEHLRTTGYDEVKMITDITSINTRELVEFIKELELNERIDIKKIDILKEKDSDAINAQLIISTLQPKAESSIEFETE